MDLLRFLEHMHGHAGWLTAAALAHPAILLRDARRSADLAVVTSTAMATVVGAAGVALYGPYRDRLKQSLYLQAPDVGTLFERKEHLAFGAILLAWAGLACYFAARGTKDDLRITLRRSAFRAYVAAAVLTFIVAGLGTVVATYKTF
jgi:hypothetical protein